MVVGAKVKGLSDSGNWTFVDLKSEDVDIRLTFKNGDPRIQEFPFNGDVMVEMNSSVSVSPVRLIK